MGIIFKNFFLAVVLVLILGCSEKLILAQTEDESVSHTPSIGVTVVPSPSALPRGAGDVTYKYAVKNFSKEIPLSNIELTDNRCTPVKFIEGDDNDDSKLDFKETWRYTCKTKVYATTQNAAKVTGVFEDVTVSHKSYSTVVVGSYAPPPIISIVNVSKVAFPYSLPAGGGDVVFIYRVSNPGDVALNNVVVTDDICNDISNKLGDKNNNELLDVTEVWMYTCTTRIDKTTTNTAYVSSSANDLYAIGEATFTVQVETTPENDIVPGADNQTPPNLPDMGNGNTSRSALWGILAGIILTLGIFFFIKIRKKLKK